MIRPLTLVCALIAAIAGGYLYHVKHQTQLLERSIARTNQAIEAARERTGVLRAEWTLMNDPDRLQELAGQHLKLATVAPRQFTTLADLGARLPVVRALPIRPEDSTDEPAMAADTTIHGAETPLPLPPPPTPPLPVLARSPTPAVTTPAVTAPVVQAHHVTAPPVAAPAISASTVTMPAAARAAPPHAAPGSAPASSAIAAIPPALVSRPAPRQEPLRAAPVAPAPANTGSALGMARSIVAPPVPVGGPGANGDIQLTRGN